MPYDAIELFEAMTPSQFTVSANERMPLPDWHVEATCHFNQNDTLRIRYKARVADGKIVELPCCGHGM